jgi:hypothetical protein
MLFSWNNGAHSSIKTEKPKINKAKFSVSYNIKIHRISLVIYCCLKKRTGIIKCFGKSF